jgi:hypothetical protein
MKSTGLLKGETGAAVISGGNIDEKQFQNILASELIV